MFKILNVNWKFEDNELGCRVDLDIKFLFNSWVYNQIANKYWETSSLTILKAFEWHKVYIKLHADIKTQTI